MASGLACRRAGPRLAAIKSPCCWQRCAGAAAAGVMATATVAAAAAAATAAAAAAAAMASNSGSRDGGCGHAALAATAGMQQLTELRPVGAAHGSTCMDCRHAFHGCFHEGDGPSQPGSLCQPLNSCTHIDWQCTWKVTISSRLEQPSETSMLSAPASALPATAPQAPEAAAPPARRPGSCCAAAQASLPR
jgi:hypothetical protein